jgi:hypothetical protein
MTNNIFLNEDKYVRRQLVLKAIMRYKQCDPDIHLFLLFPIHIIIQIH